DVTVGENVVGKIAAGWLVLLGVAATDKSRDVTYLVEKTANLRAFPDSDGKMNRSVKDAGGAILVVSQFTLYGDCRKGRRPSFGHAAPPEKAHEFYHQFCEGLTALGIEVAKGTFQAHMQVRLINDGPVTFVLDSSK